MFTVLCVCVCVCSFTSRLASDAHSFEHVSTWFYLHDTFLVSGSGFWPNVTKWCATGLPGGCALPLTRYGPSASAGLYDAAFLASKQALLTTALKNRRSRPPAVWKKMAINHEDKLFKLCDATSAQPVRRFTRRCYNATLQRRTCICSNVAVSTSPVSVYGEGSAPRIAFSFPCADLVKYKANHLRNQSLVLSP